MSIDNGDNSSSTQSRYLSICFFGTYNEDFPRNFILLRGLKELGHPALECSYPFWSRIWAKNPDRHSVGSSIAVQLRIATRFVRAYSVLAFRFFRLPRVDFFVVGYPGYFDVIFLSLLKKLARKNRKTPIAYVPCISVFDTIYNDRGLFSRRDPRVRIFHLVDALSLRLSDIIFADTWAYGRFFTEEFGISRSKLRRLYVGADEDVFKFNAPVGRKKGEPLKILFFGNYIPNHRIETIVEAARQLDPDRVHFTFLGKGQQFDAIKNLIGKLKIPEKMIEMDTDSSPENVAAFLPDADLVLGIFGTVSKADNTIPLKVFITLAAGRPLLTAATSGANELLTHGENAFLTIPADPDDLAKGIKVLEGDPELLGRLAAEGHRLFQRHCSREVLARQMIDELSDFSSTPRTDDPH